MKPWLKAMFTVVALAACDRPDEPPPMLDPAPTQQVDIRAVVKPDHVVDTLLIWEVFKQAAPDKKSHLVGTYHVGTDFTGLEELPEPGRQAFEGARVIVLEADTGVVDPQLQKLVLLDGPRTLDAMLTPEQWDVALEHTGLPPQQLKRLRPHAVAAELTRKWTPQAGVRGMDGRLRILAKAHEKPLAFLETPHEQLEVIDAAVDLEMIAKMLDDADAEQERLARVLTKFEAGDALALQSELFPPDAVASNEAFYKRVFWDRNAAWVTALEPILTEGNAFVAVGVGHLLGERNLRDLLEESGYEVRPASP